MGASRFYGLLSALLFTAVCAYMAAAVFAALDRQPRQNIPALAESRAGELRGIVLRREGQAPEAVTAAAGERVPSGDAVEESAVFLPVSDGYEHLSPDDIGELSVKTLHNLMQAKPRLDGGAKLVYGFDCYYAAFYYGSDDIELGPCRLKFQGESKSRRAELVSLSRSGTECAVLFRLMADGELMEMRFCEAEILASI